MKRKNIWNTKGYLVEYMFRDFDNSLTHSIRHFKTYSSFSRFFKYLLDSDEYFIRRVYKNCEDY